MENRTKYGPDEYAEELVNMEEWDEGSGAAHNGYFREENPYPKDVKKWDAWNAGYDAEAKTYGHHCQSGHADLCLAARTDGVVCPHDSCDINDGVVILRRNTAKSPTHQTKQTKPTP